LFLVTFDESDDWALFERRDGKSFSIILPICNEAELPVPSSGTIFSQYYYSLGPVVNTFIKDICIWSENKCLLQYDDNRMYAIIDGGKTAGSSGSPAVTRDGKAFGMHVDSFNELADMIADAGNVLPVSWRQEERKF